ncbi:heat shock protein 20.5, putative [Ixodes scapularis]|uniref:Heat shock protein 20.5, putative n=1 Tax=Ixodes scapularis TaxID=6945 RepID=B7PWF5_IXOSC|nr:heat shock protein 20.5, putative [Ixodes scapularis]|eukprot:XP_002409748.1 heat shock protein 20.5, putative [Ixodes scapularis]
MSRSVDIPVNSTTQTRTEVKKFHRVFEGTSASDVRRQMDEFAKEFPDCMRYLDGMFPESSLLPSSAYNGAPRPERQESVVKEVKVLPSTDKDKISVEIDVEGFKADDVTLKAVGRQLNVRAFCEHAEGDTKIRRELRRNVVLPEGVDVEKIACRLTAENKLVIEIPLPVEKSKGVEYVIPVRCEIARSVSKEGEATTTKTVER